MRNLMVEKATEFQVEMHENEFQTVCGGTCVPMYVSIGAADCVDV